MPTREDRLIEKVLSFNSDIRYCGIIDKNGKLIAGRMKKGIRSLEPASKDTKLVFQMAVLRQTDQDWDPYLSPTDYILIRKKKINLILYPIEGLRGVLVSTKPEFSAGEMERLRETIAS